jgi:hypothetical protein
VYAVEYLGLAGQIARKVITQSHRRGERKWSLVQASRNVEQEKFLFQGHFSPEIGSSIFF